MNKVYITLLLVFITIAGIYISIDSLAYQVQPCAIPPMVFNTIEEDIEAIVVEEITTEENDGLYTPEERELLARVIMSEGGSLPRHGKLAIMATIMSRVNSPKYPNTIEEVLYNTGFSFSDNGEPNAECYEVIDDYISSGWPTDLYWFRDTTPHSYGYEYLHIGNMYFNTEQNYYE